MQQVLVIHGGDSFATHEEYLAFLREQNVSLEDLPKGWKSTLSETLGSEYQVVRPQMPNALNARYDEWKLWFEKYLSLLDNGLILIGHSLGGSFLAKYLATEHLSKTTRALFLVAPPYNLDSGRVLVEFDAPEDLSLLSEQVPTVFLYHSTDDPIVAYGEFEKFKTALPNAIGRSYTDRGHFIDKSFPEIVADIRSLT